MSSVLTIGMTVWNVRTKGEIDAAATRVQQEEAAIHARAEAVEESKERVVRYTWVRSVFDDLKKQDSQGKTMGLALIRLALTSNEATTLFAGLAQSTDKDLKETGQKGLDNLDKEGSGNLISRLNGEVPEDRKAALSVLVSSYRDSSATISAVLRLFDQNAASPLSGAGVINALHFLANTDPSAWKAEQTALAETIAERVAKRSPGPQTQGEIADLKALLRRAGSAR